MLKSILCRREHFDTAWFAHWGELMAPPGSDRIHRKLWEFSAICQALTERGCLTPGKRGLGFAVGQEPLVSLFAGTGAEIVATDLGEGDASSIWRQTGQHSETKDSLYRPEFLSRDDFEARVTFHPADMTDLSGFAPNSVDFLWSSCAMEHLGTLEAGLRFVEQAMDILKPGGVACHTTEFNVSSMDATVETGINVLYRESDLRRLDCKLREKYCCIEEFDLAKGDHPDDVLCDEPPYGQLGRHHVKLRIEGFVSTSTLLICRKFG